MKHYTLKKDLPTFKAGEEFYLNENGNLVSVEKEPLVAYSRQTLEEFPDILTDWFEEIGAGFYLADSGEIIKYDSEEDPYCLNYRKSIGNDFETEEEAEKAVERLRAWKRLKDKGFRFDGYDVVHNSNGDLCGQLFYNAGDYCIEDIEKDLDLLFSGEDD